MSYNAGGKTTFVAGEAGPEKGAVIGALDGVGPDEGPEDFPLLGATYRISALDGSVSWLGDIADRQPLYSAVAFTKVIGERVGGT